MPTYHFHVEGDLAYTGVDLNSVVEAKCEAARFAGQVLCDAASKFWTSAEFHLRVSDEHDLTLFTLSITSTDAPAIAVSPRIRPILRQ